jgi:nucleoside-diphosphate-sugar epimerase
MENARKKILITGAAGLIGNPLANTLGDNFDVIGVDNYFRPNIKVKSENFIMIDTDINSFLSSNTNDFDYIFHFSAINGTKYFYEIPNELVENNVLSDLNVFKFAKQNENCKLIYASSSEIVSDTDVIPTPEQVDISIKNIHNPRWSYRLSKILAENYLVNSNIKYLIVRFFNVYGENSKSGHFIADIKEKIENKDYKIMGAKETRSFCHVNDAVNAIANIFEIAENEIINVGNDEEITISDAVQIISKTLGISIQWEFQSSVDGSTQRRSPCIDKLKQFFPNYLPMSFEEGVKRVFNEESE